MRRQLFCLLSWLGFLRFSATTASTPQTFDINIANISAWLSSYSYCSSSTYSNLSFIGPTSGFVYTNTIYDQDTDTVGYVGYHPREEKIWVVFRGSETVENWLTDISLVLVNADITLCPFCKIHDGFKAANLATIDQVTAAVQSILTAKPAYSVVVTGHSLGGAVATLASISLLSQAINIPLLTHYSFGSPRVGDSHFSTYVSRLFSTAPPIRMTHYRDPVPHTPFESFGFKHIAEEVYEDAHGVLHGCQGLEDSSCSDQFELFFTDVIDHLVYLGHDMTCG